MKPCRSLRRASRPETARACFIRNINVDTVADAWIDEDGRVDLVLHGFTDRMTVNLNFAPTENPA